MQLSRNHLAAALEAAGTKDVRYYLNGVYIERHADGRIQYTGTNGHIAFTCWDDTEQGTDCEPFTVIIPHTSCRTIVKAADERLDIIETEQINGKGRCFKAAHVNFQEIDGRYPDYRRIIPSETSGEPGQYASEYLRTLDRAFMRLAGKKGQPKGATAYAEVMHNGNSLTPVVSNRSDAVGIIMGMRTNIKAPNERLQGIVEEARYKGPAPIKADSHAA